MYIYVCVHWIYLGLNLCIIYLYFRLLFQNLPGLLSNSWSIGTPLLTHPSCCTLYSGCCCIYHCILNHSTPYSCICHRILKSLQYVLRCAKQDVMLWWPNNSFSEVWMTTLNINMTDNYYRLVEYSWDLSFRILLLIVKK